MSQFAIVAPPQVIRGLRKYGTSIVGRYHLQLAHDVVKRRPEYFELLPEGSLIIMDNSVIELGHPVPADIMKEALSIVPAQIVVLPDKIRNMQETLTLSHQGVFEYGNIMKPHQRFMAVPQGNSLEELKVCAVALARLSGVGFWGVGRFVTELLGSRKEFVEWLWHATNTQLPASQHGPGIHLLGFSDNLADDLECSMLPGVLGIDSAVPIRMGQAEYIIDPKQVWHSPRGMWWQSEDGKILPHTVANIVLMREWLHKTHKERWVRPHNSYEGTDTQVKGSTETTQKLKDPYEGLPSSTMIRTIAVDPNEEGATDASRDQDCY